MEPAQTNPLPFLRPQAAGQGRRARHAQGMALRGHTARACHGAWQAPPGRADPVGVLVAQGQQRIQDLLPVRYARMLASPFAFLRGAAAVMAADLAHTPAAGPRVQSCGDCHLANFGSYASPEGTPVFDINDFDETLSAPFEWDIKRLGTSLVLAGRQYGLSDGRSRALAVSMARAYAVEMKRLSRLSPLAVWADPIDLSAAIAGFADRRARTLARTLLAQRMESARRHYGLVDTGSGRPALREHRPLVMRLPAHDGVIRKAFARYLATQPAELAVLLDRYALRDVIFKVVGIGSVGTFCAIGLFATADGDMLLLQIKEAQQSVLAPFAGPSPFHNQGQRVVTGQRIMQAQSDIFLGWTHSAGSPDMARDMADLSGAGRQFYVRRLKDARLAAIGSDITAEGLPDYAHLYGRTLARAHARSGDSALISGYVGKGNGFSDAIGSFSVLYADQTKADWITFRKAVKAGRIVAAG
ncbi:DUF2252 domain-containing protein [Komagataeibacter rhaeticus]|uniref:DUF2252 domain-containing protein n=1 Tax=Komagataeibacter rhaeticus TaxID=215221 RepID=UPI0004D842CD|nr:hypothetical protein GLUCORHAEAF1_02115 [Komagataeibacter rhaeticus AF1]MBL7238979.1 DUF2252 domain-containing protein [Komagataeibacter rhaeticus]PYD54250.1 DUF2252 domain-containing protein [Komagataeibacter rhaeticus]GBQ15003.1 hypothetical protein AA16663_1955 [Komagataeibacter rhaeticus DSM 16663]